VSAGDVIRIHFRANPPFIVDGVEVTPHTLLYDYDGVNRYPPGASQAAVYCRLYAGGTLVWQYPHAIVTLAAQGKWAFGMSWYDGAAGASAPGTLDMTALRAGTIYTLEFAFILGSVEFNSLVPNDFRIRLFNTRPNGNVRASYLKLKPTFRHRGGGQRST
jgi:hypothetical protein